MERLTRRNQDGAVALNCSENKAIDRLAAYEDTGLTPGEIREDMPDITAIEAKLDYYQQAEADGRLVVLPCKVGTPIWRTHKVFGEASISGETFKLDDLSQYGKTVFLTREEAEAALKKEVKDDG